MKKGKPGPVGAWVLRHPLLGLLLIPLFRFMPRHWLAVATDDEAT